MTPVFHPRSTSAILALAAIDYVAVELPSVPPPTVLLLNSLWTYGRNPPSKLDGSFDEEEVLSLGWFEAIYQPGMAYLLNEMRLRNEPETPHRWFHDAVYVAALHTFALFEAAERDALTDEQCSSCPSDVAEIEGLDDLVRACGEAIGQVDEFALHFSAARERFKNELEDPECSLWPPLNGATRAGVEEWFA